MFLAEFLALRRATRLLRADARYELRNARTEVASWYGPGFAGRRTSTGEIYNPEGLTAASTTLPLGSHVRVVNPDTGRSVVVRINDRGPYVRGRSLDLSHGAAQQIGLTGKGVGRVRSYPDREKHADRDFTQRGLFLQLAWGLVRAAAPSSLHFLRVADFLPDAHRTRHRYHHYSSTRIVSNPIGAWLSSAFPRF